MAILWQKIARRHGPAILDLFQIFWMALAASCSTRCTSKYFSRWEYLKSPLRCRFLMDDVKAYFLFPLLVLDAVLIIQSKLYVKW